MSWTIRAIRSPLLVSLALAVAAPGWAGVEKPGDSKQSATDCRDGTALDDGSVETGYGFVPSSEEGVFVQRFERTGTSEQFLTEVCICWLKTRGDRNLDFEVVLFQDVEGRPAEEPLFEQSASAVAEQVAPDVESAGGFVRVEVPSFPLPKGPFFLGVRWNPGTASYLFICADKTPRPAGAADYPMVPGFFREDVVPGWNSLENARDPNMRGHHALMIRAVWGAAQVAPSQPEASAPPALRTVP